MTAAVYCPHGWAISGVQGAEPCDTCEQEQKQDAAFERSMDAIAANVAKAVAEQITR